MDQNQHFATTLWSVVRQASAEDSKTSRSALQQLCQIYWYPLYSYVRFKGYKASEAEDLTQSFFADLLERQDIKKVQPELGRFRSFLLAAMKHFLLNEWDKKQAQKRGGGRVHFSIDFPMADSRYRDQSVDGETPEAIFERQWAMTLLERVHKLLRQDYEKRGKGHVFDRLKLFLGGKGGNGEQSTLAQAAGELGMTEVAVKVALHRMRARFGDLLRQQIQATVDSDQDVEDEIAQLFAVLRQ